MTCLHPGDVQRSRPVAVTVPSPAAEPETEALAAIMSGYENARARIISAPATPAGRHGAGGAPVAGPIGVAPTVPVDLRSGLPWPPPALLDRAPAPSTASGRRRSGLLRSLLTRLSASLRCPSPVTSGPEHPLRWT